MGLQKERLRGRGALVAKIVRMRRKVHSVRVHCLILILHLVSFLLQLFLLLITGLALVLRVLFGQRWASQARLAPEFSVITSAIDHLILNHVAPSERQRLRRCHEIRRGLSQ